ncbi:MAG: hypothetical protein AMJ55_00340 [Gammaproteobacteria bacterium SG8_15]|nr:MAG: hypothetical protein AMJ55_00340 [Gammaproteobacteria bacterium SG8_15]
MKAFLERLGRKLSSGKFMMFVVLMVALCLFDFPQQNADVLKTLIIAVFGANAAVHVSDAVKRRKE